MRVCPRAARCFTYHALKALPNDINIAHVSLVLFKIFLTIIRGSRPENTSSSNRGSVICPQTASKRFVYKWIYLMIIKLYAISQLKPSVLCKILTLE
jgi:hypothetical protein